MNFNKSASKMFTRTLSAVALTSGLAAASVAGNQEALESKVDSANAHRGLEVTGAVRGVAQASYLNIDQDKYGRNTMPDVERNEFVTADFNFTFRPWENVRANAMLRLYGGMQDYFASAAKIIEVPWLNVEGQIGNNIYWTVGDFRQQYSPLTLFAPSLDILYEPTVFARKRHMAEKQQLLEGNQRNLQGANLQFRMELNEMLGEVRAEALVARINRAQFLDLTGAEGNILPQSTIPGASLGSNYDKFVAAANVELFPVKKNVYVGATAMYIFDNESSHTYAYRHPDNIPGADYPDSLIALDPSLEDASGYYERVEINPYEQNTQNTSVIAVRAGADIAGLMGNSNLLLDVTAEVAMSNNDGYVIVDHEKDGDVDYTYSVNDPMQEGVSGMAINANVNAGFKTAGWQAKLEADVIYNDSSWFNNLAQSPKFFAQRVLNSDHDIKDIKKGINTVKYTVNSPYYSTFDALYNFAPKFSPVSITMKTNDDGFNVQGNSYNIAPYSKNSWTALTFSQAQLKLLEQLSDPTLQMMLPNGVATSNRVGARGNLTFDLGGWLEVQGVFGTFSQVEPVVGLSGVSYLDFGGGAKFDIAKVLGWSKALEVSGSYRHTGRTMDIEGQGSAEANVDFVNASLYVQYLPRLGITAGFQMANMEMNEVQQTASVNSYANIAPIVPLSKGSQMQWMVGLDYTIDKNAWLSLNFGMVSVENTYNLTADADKAVNLPIYAVDEKVDGAWPQTYTSQFSQTIVEASINVEF